ncbi:hypothetical protein BOTBODRAFT_28547 [Botryobasidium botryosum FD-172 SS1]|uniref:Uncharacterized protein n=1 Tax=Botryobasidium botryosum (strain FD-172 SS1) TaxID=930990 RepID=A0A067MTH2_BOTB1|nr:hypothetical protein BOTBODRAFT_28547 [Botryobasidium botryosum FD-172 SS1]
MPPLKSGKSVPSIATSSRDAKEERKKREDQAKNNKNKPQDNDLKKKPAPKK